MKRKIFKRILSLVLVLCMVIPSSLMTALAADEVEYEYDKVSVQNPVSNTWFETTETTGDGPASWAFDGNSATWWHTNWGTATSDNPLSGSMTWGSVSTVPAYADVASGRAWIGGEFAKATSLGRFTYVGRSDKSANWFGQYALYTANVTDREVTDADFTLAYTATNSGSSKITVTLDTPVTATHFKFVVFTATSTNFATASEIEMYEAVIPDTTPGFGGSIVDIDTQYTQDRFSEVKKMSTTSASLSAWKNDKALSAIALVAKYAAYENVTVTASDLTDGKGNTISSDNVTTTFIKSTKAYNGDYLGYGSPDRAIPADNGTNRSESSDILYQTTPVDMKTNAVQPVWVEFAIPENAAAGTYTGTITVTADGADPLEFTYTVKVYDVVLPDATEFVDTFDIMQWQYPYSSAEYYNVEPFSPEHMEILESIMGIYKEVGGNAITTTFTEEAWSGQTYSANSIHYPSMVKWTKNADGTFSYDYTDFDAWVSFCKGMGLGDKIVAYGIAPWHFSFTYWENGASTYTKEGYTVGNARYREVWGNFLNDFADHLEDMGWKENVYVGIDERSVNATAFDLADAAGLKTAADIDNITGHWEIAQRVTDLNVGDTAAQNHAAKFAELLAIRDAKGYKTTLYSCTEHQPGQFSLSAPVESYWAVLNAGMMGADGFNRWAYDAWVADPLNDATHNSFEPGDCFVIYPDEKDAENPQAKYSVRLARMAQGIRDVNKLRFIAEQVPSLSGEVDAAFDNIQYTLRTSRSYMSDSQVKGLSNETAAFQSALNEVTEKYVESQVDIADEKKVSYYSFDNVTDTTLVDEWGDRDGVIAGSTAAGKSGNALSVTEAGVGATIDGSLNTLDTDWTVGYWVKTTADFTGEISVVEDAAKAYSASLKMADGRASGFRVGNNSGDVLTYAYDFEKDVWYHITWVQDKDQGLAMYVNGTLVQSNNWTTTHTIKAPIDVIGGTGFTGLIDEVKVFNAVLTQEEIVSLMRINGINVAAESVKLNVGDTYNIKASVVSENADKTITYTSNDENIATVSDKGVITGKRVGRTTITLTAPGGFETTINVQVSREVSILNELTIYDLPEEYQSNVEGAAHDEEGTLAGTNRQYLGQPDMVRTDTGRLITVFPTGHGHGPLIMKYSEDDGETWTEVDTPDSWDDSQETPTIYSLRMEDGSERLVLICACPGSWGNYTTGWDFSYSDDNGETWTEFEHFWSTFSNGNRNPVTVGMASLVQLKDEEGNYIQKWMGVYHDGGAFYNYKTYLTFDEEGNPEWSEPVKYLSDYRSIESSHQICEVGMFRSPDGERIVALARNQTHSGPATMFYSDDEGETWSEPVELPGSLAGERHKALYDPISDRLLITYREIDYDRDNDGAWEGGSDWTAGDWVAWVGTYDDLMNLEQGDYMIRLDEDFSNNYYSGDTGYTGMVVLEDGTFVLHSYGHWDQEFSQNYRESNGSYNVRTDLCWIRQAKFKIADVENEYDLVDYSELEACIEDCMVSEDVEYTEETYTVYANAIIKAVTMVQSKNVQQVEVDAMITELTEAYEGLEEGTGTSGTVNKTALAIAIALAELLSADDYTADSWAPFAAALAAAKSVNADTDATQEAVNTALANLTAAQDALEEKSVDPQPPVDPVEPVVGNIAPGKTVVVSGTSNFVPGHVNDEDTNTRWDSDLIKSGQGANASDIGDAWIYIDLGADVRYEISQIVVKFYNLVYPTSWVIQVSDDATNWDDVTDVLTKENAGPAHPVETIDFETPFTGRYVRLYFNTLNTAAAGHGVGITEFEIYGTESDEQPPVVEPVNPFEDVYDTDYYYDPVMWAVENGITDGWTPTTFAPEMGCTRGQVVTFLWRAAGEPEVENAVNPFTDVAENAYYYYAVLWAVENGITDGWTATTFAPDMTCTRGQIVTFIWRAAGEPEVTAESPFTDVAENAYYYDAVLWAVENGITDGWTATTFAPDMTCTRGQVVTFLYRHYNVAE